MTTAPQEALLAGMAALLDGHGFTYRTEGAYTPDEVGVYFEELPPTGRAVALTVYAEEIVDRSSIRYLVQARIRGTRADSATVDAALAWQQHPPMPAGVDVVQITPRGFVNLGRTAGLLVHSRNYSALT